MRNAAGEIVWDIVVIDTGQTGTEDREVLRESLDVWPRLPVKGDVIELASVGRPYRVGLVVFQHEAKTIRVELA